MKQTLLFFLALTTALFAQDKQDAPTTMDDLTAIDQLESGEIGADQPATYTREQVDAFLDQYVGVWEGDYVISAMQGSGKVTMTTHAQYFWELVGETRVLKNQSVYATSNQLSYANSISYYWAGRLVTEVEQDGIKKIFLGRISKEGDSVSWRVANTENPLDTATQETFSVNDAGEAVIKVTGYEELRQGNQVAYLQLKAELVKGVLEE